MAVLGALTQVLRGAINAGGIARATRLVERYGTGVGTINRIRSVFPELSQKEAGRLFSIAQSTRRGAADVQQGFLTGKRRLSDIPVLKYAPASDARGRRIVYDMTATIRNPDGYIVDRREYRIYANAPLSEAQLRNFMLVRTMSDVGSPKLGIVGAAAPTADDIELDLRSIYRFF